MGIQPQAERRFDKTSPVARYWLAQCEGFRVRGPLKGTVEQIVGSGDLHDAEELIVRTARGRRVVPVDSVEVVVPASRLIVVDGRRERRRPSVLRRAAPPALTAVRSARTAGRGLAKGVLGGLLLLGQLLLIAGAVTTRTVAAISKQLRYDLHAWRVAVADRRRRGSGPV